MAKRYVWWAGAWQQKVTRNCEIKYIRKISPSHNFLFSAAALIFRLQSLQQIVREDITCLSMCVTSPDIFLSTPDLFMRLS